MSTSYLDISGLLLAQANYLQTLNENGAADSGRVNAISTGLNNVLNSWTAANRSGTAVLTSQDKVNTIVNDELQRLQTKKSNIDNALVGQQRSIQLNDSYRKRFQYYTKMVVVVIVCLAIFIGAIMLGKMFPIIPSFIIDILCIIIVATGVIATYFIYIDIQSRDKNDFDKLDLNNPNILSPEDIKRKTLDAQRQGDLLGSVNLGQCVGAACCNDASGTVWSPERSVCVSKPTPAFTTMVISQTAGDLSRTQVSANSPYEFEKYAKVGGN